MPEIKANIGENRLKLYGLRLRQKQELLFLTEIVGKNYQNLRKI